MPSESTSYNAITYQQPPQLWNVQAYKLHAVKKQFPVNLLDSARVIKAETTFLH
jgi:hypothetical protein